MRACLTAWVIAQFALACVLQMGVQAQEVRHPGTATPNGDVADIAEQLVAQAEKWFETLGAQGRVPRVFTGITREPRQFIVELDGLPFDHVKRRDFLIWLSQKYDVIAYAYATRVMTQRSGKDDLAEALVFYASSSDKDVVASLSIARRPDGSIRLARGSYLSKEAKEQRDQIFLGLHRSSRHDSIASAAEFEKVWATIENKVFWRSVGGPSGDEAGALITRALTLYAAGNCESAISLGEQAAELLRKQRKEESSDFADALVAQALCHKKLVHVAEAERLYRQAIGIYEKVGGLKSRELAIALDNLAALYVEHGRLPEAERLRLRALQIFKATLDPASPHIATTLQNLAVLYQFQGRDADAQEKFLEALPIAEKAYGADSRQVGVISDNLAGLYRSQRQFEKAERLYLRAILIFEKALGRDHPDTALALQNHAILLSESGRPSEAETVLKEALAINERVYGPVHNTISAALNTLVLNYIERQRWADALDPARRSAAISVQLADRGNVHLRSEGGQRVSAFRRLVQAAYGAGPSSPELMNEGYIAAQRALDSRAAFALSQLAARHTTADSRLALLLRERQDLLQKLEDGDKRLIAAVATAADQRDLTGEERLRSGIEAIGGRIDAINLSLSKQFPEYASLARPTPISIAETQKLLNPNEALLLYLDLQPVSAVPETGFAWLVTKEGAEWVSLPIGTHGLARAVATLRCGLDAKRWSDGVEISCPALLNLDKSARAWLPFDVNVAFELYQTLVRPFEAKIKDKHLLVVPTGALAGLPLSVLVTEKPVEAVPSTLHGYRRAAWLGQRQPITVLPSASSLRALRQYAKNSRATKAYLGIGNPLLDGAQDDHQFGAYYKKQAQLALDNQLCSKTVTHRIAANRGQRIGSYTRLFRGTNADIEVVRASSPLPETADELCEVGRLLGVPKSDILLGGRATESALKGRSEQGHLTDYKILHFATHGALTGEVQGSAEPGLILTPPAKGTTDPKALDRDDGFLTASEITTLKLDADWVILSACNTAGGSGETAEALSGMARAFFYAGARALLVSHWEVDSDAAIKLVTHTFAELGSTPKLGRAEALRNSIRELIQKGRLADAHPSQWAPFVVVGEGSPRVRLASKEASPSGLGSQKGPPRPSKAKASQPATIPDWRTELRK
jgi:CHAT domain-containing protein/Tfp pilus assembly protein PilF